MPQIGEIRKGRDIGNTRKPSANFIWHTCVECSKNPHWVRCVNGKPTNLMCRYCAAKRRAPRYRGIEQPKGTLENPQIGDIRYGDELGKSDRASKYQYLPCIDCSKIRWVPLRNGKSYHPRCVSCALKARPHQHHKFKRSGYYMVYKPEHPRQSHGYVAEHIIVWEEDHKQQVPKGWVIHHLNGDTLDNRPENLVALPNQKHRLILAEKAKWIRELEAENTQLKKLLQKGN